MKSNTTPRRGRAIVLVLIGMVAASSLIFAQSQGTQSKTSTTPSRGPIASFSGVAANVGAAGDTVRIDLLRWSTDAEREQFLSAMGKGEKELAGMLEKAPTLGYLWTSESAGYSLRYAHRLAMPDGGERLIFVTDRRLGSWNPRLWSPAGSATTTDYPFTLVELRLNRKGEGEGKTSLTAKITVDAQAKTLALENYATAMTLFKSVKR
jgi:hypothetical protein